MINLEVGQVWQEVDPRFFREVTITGFCTETGKILLSDNSTGRKTRASAERFNGKRGGYKLTGEKK